MLVTPQQNGPDHLEFCSHALSSTKWPNHLSRGLSQDRPPLDGDEGEEAELTVTLSPAEPVRTTTVVVMLSLVLLVVVVVAALL